LGQSLNFEPVSIQNIFPFCGPEFSFLELRILANDCPFIRKWEKEQSVINSKLPFFVVKKR